MGGAAYPSAALMSYQMALHDWARGLHSTALPLNLQNNNKGECDELLRCLINYKNIAYKIVHPFFKKKMNACILFTNEKM